MEGRSKKGRNPRGGINPHLESSKVCKIVHDISDTTGGTEQVQSLNPISVEQYIIKIWNSDGWISQHN